MLPYLEEGRVVRCGDARGTANVSKGKACRPLRRVSKETPATLSELVKRHGKARLIKLARQKARDMDGRVRWKVGEFQRSGG